MRRLVLLVLIGAVFGCANDMDDLRSYAEEVKSRRSAEVEPPPAITPYLGYTYAPAGRRSPFQPPIDELRRLAAERDRANEPTVIPRPVSSDIRPNLARTRGPLERMPLDSFRVVGLVDWKNRRHALVRSSEPYVYRVTAGDYLGQNYGKILRISNREIAVRELIPDGFGGWSERITTIQIDDSNDT